MAQGKARKWVTASIVEPISLGTSGIEIVVCNTGRSILRLLVLECALPCCVSIA
jgi:hypothetical protein